MGYGISRGYYVGSNIADWKTNIKFLLKKPFREPKHHPSLHYSKLPDFYAQLCEIDTTATRALRFAILTVARTSEVTLMSYGEVDLDKKIWTIPGERMKAHKEHRVPLSEEALIVLDILSSKHNYFHIFQGHKPDTPLSNNAMGKFVRDNYRHMKFTVHGSRSTFRDWAAETGNYDQNMVEFALAHQLPTRSQAAYFRSDLFDKRKILMDDWAEFVTSKKNRKNN
jgi:integrase